MTILYYPSVSPNKITNFTLPDYRLIEKTWDDGGENRRTAQHSGAGTALSLSYQFISAENTAFFIEFWRKTSGTWLSFLLPNTIIQHPDNIKVGLANLDSTTLWRFSEGMSIKTDYATLQRGLYSFDVKVQSVVS